MAIKRKVNSNFEATTDRASRQMNIWAGKPAKGVPWIVIVILFISFFPAGIALMLMKLHKEKENCIGNGKGTAAVGWVFIVLGIFYAFIGIGEGLLITDDSSTVGAALFMVFLCCGGGFALVKHGNKYKKIGADYLRYSAIIRGIPNGSIDRIASACQKTSDEVISDLQKMIDLGFFPSYYIDLNQRMFVSPYIKPSTSATPVAEQPKVVKCPNCGAVNTIRVGLVECEYCGTPLTK